MARALILGGTRFIRRATVEHFREAGYDMTIFTRGNRPDLFVDDPRVDHITGN